MFLCIRICDQRGLVTFPRPRSKYMAGKDVDLCPNSQLRLYNPKNQLWKCALGSTEMEVLNLPGKWSRKVFGCRLWNNGMKAAVAFRHLIISWEKPGGCSCSGSAVSSRTGAGSIFLLCLPWALLSTSNLVPSWLQNDLHCIITSQVWKKVVDTEQFFFNGKGKNYLKLRRNLPL